MAESQWGADFVPKRTSRDENESTGKDGDIFRKMGDIKGGWKRI